MSKRGSAETGAKGEHLAAVYYQRRGCEILDTNYRTRMGELDLVVMDHGTLVFSEVKTRSENTIATPSESVTKQKQRRLILAAQNYLMTHTAYADLVMRFDVVEVILPRGGLPRLHCIENAFTL